VHNKCVNDHLDYLLDFIISDKNQWINVARQARSQYGDGILLFDYSKVETITMQYLHGSVWVSELPDNVDWNVFVLISIKWKDTSIPNGTTHAKRKIVSI
jgi:hypothetical protein